MATVLVVDNEPDIRELVRLTLELDGHAVITAADGVEALDLTVRRRPDVVVLDLRMPNKSGWQVLAEMKGGNDPTVAATPVILLTARVDDLARIRGGIEGAIRYLTKPFSPTQMRAEVTAALARPEPTERRKVQAEALAALAHLEAGTSPPTGPLPPRPHLTRLDRAPGGRTAWPVAPAKLAALSPKQHEVLRSVGATSTVSEAADQMGVSRSNVYASLRRIARRLGVRSVPELLSMARSGDLPGL